MNGEGVVGIVLAHEGAEKINRGRHEKRPRFDELLGDQNENVTDERYPRRGPENRSKRFREPVK